MNIEAIQAFGLHDEVAPKPPTGLVPSGASFLQRVSEGLEQVNQGLLASQADLQRLAAGDAGNLHDIVIRLEENRISLQLLLQVRNRVLEAYQDVMRMQL